VVPRFLCLLAFLIGAFCTGLLSLGGHRAATSKSWPVTKATVVAFRGTPNYQYTVGGNTYLSDRVSCNELFGWSRELTDSENYAVRYPLNATVTTHYHPGKPDVAVLETSFDSGVFWKEIGGITLAMLVFGYGAIFRGTWRWTST
jgi:hypothetical protein